MFVICILTLILFIMLFCIPYGECRDCNQKFNSFQTILMMMSGNGIGIHTGCGDVGRYYINFRLYFGAWLYFYWILFISILLPDIIFIKYKFLF